MRSEVKGCDITATMEDDLVVVELKRSLSVALLAQAAQRQRVTDSVYVAIPWPATRQKREEWRGVMHLLRRLELGLILVSFTSGKPVVEIAFHPVPYERRHNKAGRRAILKEIAGRSGEFNQGGSSRRKLLTAYRENALLIACCLEKHGSLSPRQLRALGTGPKTLAILHRNVYGWFERRDRALYGLKPEGETALAGYPDLVEQLRKRLEASAAPADANSVATS